LIEKRTPKFKVIFPDQDSGLIDPELKRRYHSGVRMSLYSIKYSKPDISNFLRDFASAWMVQPWELTLKC
jgi:hypothetical protein